MSVRVAAAVALVAACSSVPDEVTGDPVAVDAGPDAAWPDTHVDCLSELFCPTAVPGTINLCGWIRDVETSQTFRDSDWSVLTCESSTDESGPCQMSLTFQDASSGAELAVEDLFRDVCGRFLARGITTPPSGTVAILTDDAIRTPDVRRLTAIAVAVGDGEIRNRLTPYSLRRSTEGVWNAVAEATFIDDGVVLEVYTWRGEPIDGLPIGTGDVAFADASIDQRTFVAPLATATGVNGSVLRRGPALTALPVPAGAPADCAWSTPYSAIVPGTLWFSTRTLVHDVTGAECE